MEPDDDSDLDAPVLDEKVAHSDDTCRVELFPNDGDGSSTAESSGIFRTPTPPRTVSTRDSTGEPLSDKVEARDEVQDWNFDGIHNLDDPLGVDGSHRLVTPAPTRPTPGSRLQEVRSSSQAPCMSAPPWVPTLPRSSKSGFPLSQQNLATSLISQAAPPLDTGLFWSRRAQPLSQTRLQRRAASYNLMSYALNLDDRVGGVPTRDGEVFLLYPEVRTLKKCTVLLFENGFYAIANGGSVNKFAWSPFTVLQEETSLRQKGYAVSDPEGELSEGFSLSMIAFDVGFVFATRGADAASAEESRCQWIADMARTLRAFTKSLFPEFSLCVEPVVGNPNTARRIIAGYLLLSEVNGVVTVVYCELQAHFRGAGLIAFYESAKCSQQIMSICIKPDTLLTKAEGIDCSWFMLADCRLSARTHEERNIWCRAIHNVQVKCSNAEFEPDPSEEDLRIYRAAVAECVAGLGKTEALRRGAAEDEVNLEGGGANFMETTLESAAAPSKARSREPRVPSSPLSEVRGGCTLPLGSAGIAQFIEAAPDACTPRVSGSKMPSVGHSAPIEDLPGIAQFIESAPDAHPLCTPRDSGSKMTSVGPSVPIEGMPGCGDPAESKPCPIVAPKLPMVNSNDNILQSPTVTINAAFQQTSPEFTDDMHEDTAREESERLAYSIPPASRPGPNMHEVLWRRPHPDSPEADVLHRHRGDSPDGDCELWQCPRADSPDDLHKVATTALTRSHHIRLLKNQSQLQRRSASRKLQERCLM